MHPSSRDVVAGGHRRSKGRRDRLLLIISSAPRPSPSVCLRVYCMYVCNPRCGSGNRVCFGPGVAYNMRGATMSSPVLWSLKSFTCHISIRLVPDPNELASSFHRRTRDLCPTLHQAVERQQQDRRIPSSSGEAIREASCECFCSCTCLESDPLLLGCCVIRLPLGSLPSEKLNCVHCSLQNTKDGPVRVR